MRGDRGRETRSASPVRRSRPSGPAHRSWTRWSSPPAACALHRRSALESSAAPHGALRLRGKRPAGRGAARARLAARGLETRRSARLRRAHLGSLVLDASDGARTFLHNPGASAALGPQDIERALETGPRWLHIGGALVLPGLDGEPLATCWQARPRARDHDEPRSGARRHRRAGIGVHACLPHLDVICPNLIEAPRDHRARTSPGGLRRLAARPRGAPGGDQAGPRRRLRARRPDGRARRRPFGSTRGTRPARATPSRPASSTACSRAGRSTRAVPARQRRRAPSPPRGLGASSTLPELEEALAL